MQHGVPMRNLVAVCKKWSRAERVLAMMGTLLMVALPLGLLMLDRPDRRDLHYPERPRTLAFIALEFFERRDLFLVSRENGMAFP